MSSILLWRNQKGKWINVGLICLTRVLDNYGELSDITFCRLNVDIHIIYVGSICFLFENYIFCGEISRKQYLEVLNEHKINDDFCLDLLQVGHNRADEFTHHWWSQAFDQAANNIKVDESKVCFRLLTPHMLLDNH